MRAQTIAVAVVIILLLIGGAFALWRRAPTVSIGPPVRPVDLSDLGVRITVPAILSDLATQPVTVPQLGTVLSMQASSIPGDVPGRGCELGVMYFVPKSDVAAVGLDEKNLKAREGGSMPQVKEFADAYFVFEPSQSSCTSDEAGHAQEQAKRTALWQSVTSAEEIAPQGI